MKLDSSPHAADSYRPRSLAEHRLRDMAPESSRSGEMPVFRYSATEEHSAVVEAKAPGIAKARGDEREAMRAHLESLRLRGSSPGKALADALKSKSYAEFLAAFKASGLSISDLARRIGKTRQYVHDMVHDRRDIPRYVLLALTIEDEDIEAIGA